MCRVRRWVFVVVGVGLLATPATAHEIGATRFDAPLPLGLLFLGAGATVGLTALVLPLGGDFGGSRRRLTSISPGFARTGRVFASLGFLALVVAAVVFGLVGKQDGSNLAIVFVWAVWLKGVALLAVLVGNPWRVLAPWRTLYAGLTWLEGERIQLRDYPERLGVWPAVAGFLLLVGVVENLTVVPGDPSLTAAVVAGYTLAMLAGGVVFGSTWFERADALAVLYRLLGRVSPISVVRTDEGGYRVALRSPWLGCTDAVRDGSVVAFVVAAVYTVSFDGFTGAPEYQTVLFGLRDVVPVGAAASVLLYLAGYGLFLASFFVVARIVGRFGVPNAGVAFAPTVVPIAAAYELAHNYPFVLTSLGQLPATVGGPDVDLLWWLSVPAFWASQVLLVVLGHVVAVIAAHAVATRALSDSRAALRAHTPLVVLMVGYTVLSLWIVSRPVVA